tara:strand:- start:275 stop:1486 length:1212 start_codon:yes stop_codon:yes gene_type:complete
MNIHDFRFLDKLVSNNHDVLLVAIDNNKISKEISNIAGLKHVLIPKPLPRYSFKFFISPRSIILAIKHMIYRIIENIAFFNNYLNKRITLRHHEFRLLYYQNRLSKIIKTFKPDILHAGWVQLDGLVAELTGFKPILQMPWGSDILINPFKSEDYLDQTQFVIDGASHITCDCEQVKKTILDIADFDKDKITVIPWGIDLELFNPKRLKPDIIDRLNWQDKRVIITTRTLSALYGIHFLIMALPSIIEEEPNVRLLIIGSGPQEEELKELVSGLELDDYVHFGGQVPNGQLAYYLNSAEIYISTSKSDGSSLSLLEAMACGLPLVVSDVPAICEWVQDGSNGYIVPRNKVKPISEKILILLKNKDTALKMGELNLNIANEKADWNKNFLKLEKIYEDMSIINS